MGYAADLTIVDVDVSADPSLLATAVVEQVWVAGVPRYDRVGAGQLPPSVQLGGPYIPGKGGPADAEVLMPKLSWPEARLPHRLACGENTCNPHCDSIYRGASERLLVVAGGGPDMLGGGYEGGCDCGEYCGDGGGGRVPFANTFLVGAKLGAPAQ